MNGSPLGSNKFNLKGIVGILLICLSMTGIGGYIISRSEKLARYDCYVWGFNHALCKYDQTFENSQRSERCVQHLKPVSECEEFPETEKGKSDALRFMSGESIEVPPGNRDYRTFHVWGK
jgi:hypothetical protein